MTPLEPRIRQGLTEDESLIDHPRGGLDRAPDVGM